MSVGNIGSGSEGRRRSLDAEINLVPFIDLLSMCICFLLMTAVWTQLGSVQVKQANGTEGAADTKMSLDLDVKFTAPLQMVISVKSGAKVIKSFQVSAANEPALLTQLDAQLHAFQADPAKKGDVSAVMITPQSSVNYGMMISVMDVFRKNRMVNLGVVPVNPALASR